jgi:hypothetical protein
MTLFINAELKDGIKRFIFWFLRALRVLRGGINQSYQDSTSHFTAALFVG